MHCNLQIAQIWWCSEFSQRPPPPFSHDVFLWSQWLVTPSPFFQYSAENVDCTERLRTCITYIIISLEPTDLRASAMATSFSLSQASLEEDTSLPRACESACSTLALLSWSSLLRHSTLAELTASWMDCSLSVDHFLRAWRDNMSSPCFN